MTINSLSALAVDLKLRPMSVLCSKSASTARVHRWIAHDDGLSVREAQELEEAHEVSTQANHNSVGVDKSV
jgi:hypothetical protein